MTFKAFSSKQRLAMTWWNRADTKAYDAIICDGAVRSGKTLSMSIGFICWAMCSFRDGSFAICGKTVTSLRRNVITPLCKILRQSGFLCEEKVSRSYMDVTAGSVTNRFYFFGGRDESSAALIQGMTLWGLFLDEAALMPRSFVEQAMARCSIKGARMWLNCNPEHPCHWLYREWICKAQEKNALHLHFTMDDNPSLSDKVRQRYERMYSGAFYDRYVKGEWTAVGGLVYPMFSPARHICPEAPVCSRYYISCDYGTVNPSSFGLWGERDGIYYRIREYYYDARKEGERRTDEEHYKALEELAGELPIVCVTADPSAASFITCIRRHGRFRVIPAENDVMAGIQQVSRLLQEDRLRFCPGCADILREFQQYSWQDSTAGDLPKKEHDHAMDDMRYFVRTIADGAGGEDFFVAAMRRGGCQRS